MKKIVLPLLLMLSFTACKKSSESPEDNSLEGKWILKQSRVSPGYPVDWETVSTDTLFIEFGENNIFRANVVFWGYNHYEILNDSVLILSDPSANTVNIPYSFTGQYLQLSQPCYDGCSYRFVR
jgi:hypothetical protein